MASDPPPAGAKRSGAEQARADFGICPRRPEQFAFHRTPAFPELNCVARTPIRDKN